MSQSRKMSMVETVSNVIIGYFVAVSSQIIIFPFFDIRTELKDNLIIGLWFTIISIIRGYVLRRFFNGLRG